MTMADACILGGAGYGGGELLRLLCRHPHVRTLRAVSRSSGGQPVWETHPNLRGLVDIAFDTEPDWSRLAASENPVVFSAMPHFELARQLPDLEQAWAGAGLSERLTLVDLSGDFRLGDAAGFERAYGRAHPYPEALDTFVYGLPERNGAALRGARRIANPGCFATAVQLALLPLAEMEGLGLIAVSAVTGSSGSGTSPSATTHHPARAGDFRAYKIHAHQHEAEIRRLLGAESARGYRLSFVPHSAPIVRGIFATVQLHTPAALRAANGSAGEHYADFYAGHPFVRLVEDTPRVAAVTGGNFCDIAVHQNDGIMAVMAALDNLVKGMAGQALQNMNLALGFDEMSGLDMPGIYPS